MTINVFLYTITRVIVKHLSVIQSLFNINFYTPDVICVIATHAFDEGIHYVSLDTKLTPC
jgi:hypothetical protein